MKHLNREQREILLGIIRDAEGRLSVGQVAAKFKAKTGLGLNRSSVRWTMRHRYADPRPILTSAQRMLLRSIIVANKPFYCRSKIAREFGELSGRSIDRKTVRNFLHRAFPELPRYKVGGGAAIRDALAREVSGIERRRAEVDRHIASMTPAQYRDRVNQNRMDDPAKNRRRGIL